MIKVEIRQLTEEKYFKQIIEELRKEYGVKRPGDVYMSEDRLNQNYNKYVTGELDVAGLFDDDQLLAFATYKVTDDGLYAADIMAFSDHRKKGYVQRKCSNSCGPMWNLGGIQT